MTEVRAAWLHPAAKHQGRRRESGRLFRSSSKSGEAYPWILRIAGGFPNQIGRVSSVSRATSQRQCLPHRKRPASNALILEDMDGVSLASSWQLPSTKDARYFRKSTKDARYSRKFTKDARHFQKYINNAQQFRKPIKHAHDCRGFIRIAN